MGLTGQVDIHFDLMTSADKFFNFFMKQQHEIPNVTERVLHAKLLQGNRWYDMGKVTKSKEKIESIDEQTKSVTFSLFDGDVEKQFKSFKIKLQVPDRGDGFGVAKWTIIYEKLNESGEPPYPYLELFTKVTRDITEHILKF